MARTKRAGILILTYTLCLGAMHAAIGFADDVFGTFMNVSEVRSGMRGHGMTVFRGTTPERFDFEVIDVLHGFKPDQDLIVFKADHPVLNHATTIGGVSGSPLYIHNNTTGQDKIIGAWAYGWPFSKDPIGGATPIANMRREMRRPIRESFMTRMRGGASLLQPSSSVGPRRQATLGAEATENPLSPQAMVQRLSTPVSCSGFGREALALFQTVATPLHLDVMQEGGGGSRAASGSYVNGGAIAISLVRGDISATAIGTVTEVHGTRVSAFGHPMTDTGDVFLPAAPARVVHVLASLQRSFKMGEALALQGSLIHDRQSAIIIDTGRHATMIPVTIRLSGLPEGVKNEWHVELAHHRALTATLLQSTVMSAVESSINDARDVVIRSESKVWMEGEREPFVFQDVGFSQAGAHSGRALSKVRAFELVEAGYTNQFQEKKPSRIEINLDLSFGRDVMELMHLRASKTLVEPGETIDLFVRYRQYGRVSQDETIRIPYTVPESSAGKTLSLAVEPGHMVDREWPKPNTWADIERMIQERYQASSLVLSTRIPTHGLRGEEHVAHELPLSQIEMFHPTSRSDSLSTFSVYARQAFDMHKPVLGSTRMDLVVRPRTERSRPSTETP